MALADTLTAAGTAALARSGARPLGSHLFPVWPGAAFAASAFPVRCAPGDNLALHVAVAQAPPGSALVVDVAGEPEYGYVDEILAVAASVRGLAGIIVDGCVRDVAAIARCGLPVVSAGVSVRAPGRDAGGSVGREVRLGADAFPVRRGDWMVVDDDGAVCLPRGRAAAIVADTVESVSRDQEVLAALCSGRSTLDVLNLDPSRVAGWQGAGAAPGGSAERAV
ncbi:RraA family protein [Actinorugispora endophytica]|uniref:Putative 4-hydroxy-4-methyl-2-oxoglutarate aldolase n=1 Tax=Actinorugispora endophytica TaxID=1605990 RepID=A0A4V3D8W7_9ACTN|nr:RraA family protein [Actinorugispora endophytica]TDQ53339.1 4-hydroxy-4-methyl-2-oxoglutarate aldolase [Actinorugispora endophytica]